MISTITRQNGRVAQVAACKPAYAGSIPASVSMDGSCQRDKTGLEPPGNVTNVGSSNLHSSANFHIPLGSSKEERPPEEGKAAGSKPARAANISRNNDREAMCCPAKTRPTLTGSVGSIPACSANFSRMVNRTGAPGPLGKRVVVRKGHGLRLILHPPFSCVTKASGSGKPAVTRCPSGEWIDTTGTHQFQSRRGGMQTPSPQKRMSRKARGSSSLPGGINSKSGWWNADTSSLSLDARLGHAGSSPVPDSQGCDGGMVDALP